MASTMPSNNSGISEIDHHLLRYFLLQQKGVQPFKGQSQVESALVDGRLDISEYTDKEGQKRNTFRILADTYRLL